MNMKIIASLLILFFLSSSSVYANPDDGMFVIKSTWPSNGQTNVPINLISGFAGSVSSGGIGSLVIGYGTDIYDGSGVPDIKGESINQSTITIMASGDPGIYIAYRGNSSGCYEVDSDCHSLSVFSANSNLPGGVKLMPNTTYAVNIKGGSSGISALRGSKTVYLTTDYSWSFTTGDGDQPLRVATPTVSRVPTPTRISLDQNRVRLEEDLARQQKKIEDQERRIEELEKQPTPTPTRKLKPSEKIIPTLSATPSVTLPESIGIPSPTSSEEGSPGTKPFYTATIQSVQSFGLRFASFFRSLFSILSTR